LGYILRPVLLLRPSDETAIMDIQVFDTALPEVKVVVPDIFEDARGFFMETFRADVWKPFGLPTEFVQDNHSGSVKGVLRGLHFQYDPPMGKLMRVTAGEAFLVAVDIRKGSPTLGKWVGIVASAKNRKQLWAPAYFARGFLAMSDWVEIQYKCTGVYNKGGEDGILWNDPAIGIEWPLDGEPILSARDQQAQTLEEWLATPAADYFRYENNH